MKKKFLDCYYFYFWTFVFGSIFGYVYEMLLHFIKYGNFESRQGLIYGPFSQVYGLGMVLFILALHRIKTPWKQFWVGFFAGGIAEFIFSYIQEFIFGSISWNYSKYFLNIDGRTSPFHMIAWGLLGVLTMHYALPLLKQMIDALKNKKGLIITIAFSIFLTVDIVLSITACIRQKERELKVPADNVIRETMDVWYPDAFLDNVYPNKKSTVIPVAKNK
ncbi:MAG: putative ABC transporter permease [Bacilli bacterium]|nr:putative ABC transporter permease [Bacilli bacterium]